MAENKLLGKISNEITPTEARRLKLPTSRKQQLWDIIKLHFMDLIKINLLTLVLSLPFLFLIMIFPSAINAYISAKYDFLGNVLIGFPGTNDSMLDAQIELIQNKYMFVLLLVPAVALLGPGLAGMFYCLRNYVWGENVTIRVDYWKGIKLGWKQYTLTTLLVGIFIGVGMTNIYMYKMRLLVGSGDVWITIAFIVSVIMFLLLASILLYLLPSMAMYDMKYYRIVKNSMILSVAMLPLTIGILILTALPFLIGWLFGINMILYLIMALFGIAVLALMWVVYCQYVLDKSVNKVSKNKAYNRGIYTLKKESGEEEQKGGAAKKVHYVNPKKKKKAEPVFEPLSKNFRREDLAKLQEDKEKFLDELDELDENDETEDTETESASDEGRDDNE
ncbi:MAG: hypothetical protein ACI4S9_01780 [Christensenellales bacterium]